MDPPNHQKSIKVGEGHLRFALCEAKSCQKIDLERSKADFDPLGSGFGPSRDHFWSHFGPPWNDFATRPGGMREATK